MEYKSLKTLNEYGCGCKVELATTEVTKEYIIELCPKHKAAPKLYEALKRLLDCWALYGAPVDWKPSLEKAEQALAYAEGREE